MHLWELTSKNGSFFAFLTAKNKPANQWDLKHLSSGKMSKKKLSHTVKNQLKLSMKQKLKENKETDVELIGLVEVHSKSGSRQQHAEHSITNIAELAIFIVPRQFTVNGKDSKLWVSWVFVLF